MASFEVSRRSTNPSDSERDTTSLSVRVLALLWRRTLLMDVYIGFIFAGALFGFVLARLQYLSIDGKFRAGVIPGDWYWLQHGYRKIGITLHLATILPAGFLVVFQVRPRSCANHRCVSFLITFISVLANHSLQSSDRPSDQRLRDYLPPSASQRRRSDDCSSFRWWRHRNSGLCWPTGHNHNAGRLHGVLQHQAPADRPASRLDVTHVVLRRVYHHIAPHHDHQCKTH